MLKNKKFSLDLYLKKLSLFVDDEFGQRFRQQFEDNRGSSELAMLETPSGDELDQISRAVAIMTPSEKENAGNLTDEQVLRIADDAKVDHGILAISINGYVLECKRVS